MLLLEMAGGIAAHSLALLSDAAHMFMDGFSLCLSWFALVISERPSTNTKTYGYHRMEILAAFLNGVFLLLLACGLIYESIHRFMNPAEVHSLIMIIVAAIGLATNLAVLYFLKDPINNHTHDLNLKSVFYHVIGDSLASVGVIIGGGIMLYTGWYILDAVVGAGIACLLLWGSKSIISDSVHILLEGVPNGISLSDVEKELMAFPSVRGIHELHIWSICSNIYALSMHAWLHDPKEKPDEFLLEEMKAMLKKKFNISHSTIQLEKNSCGENNVLCEMKH